MAAVAAVIARALEADERRLIGGRRAGRALGLDLISPSMTPVGPNPAGMTNVTSPWSASATVIEPGAVAVASMKAETLPSASTQDPC